MYYNVFVTLPSGSTEISLGFRSSDSVIDFLSCNRFRFVHCYAIYPHKGQSPTIVNCMEQKKSKVGCFLRSYPLYTGGDY